MEEEKICPKTADLCNTLNSNGLKLANSLYILDRKDFINTYSQEVIDACWKSLSINIIQNYQRGKGTFIKGLGTFTYKSSSINLEGTTNQFIRDKRPRVPIFIISKELNDKFCAGEYTKQNGIIYYTQKESKDISIVKLNLAEISYSLSISKEEVGHLLKHLIGHVTDSIIKRTFKSKILPGLGVLLSKNNIIAVKFDDNFIFDNKGKNQLLNFTKKNIMLDNDMEKAQNVMANQCLTPFENIEKLKAKNALKTVCEKSGKEYLNGEYDIDVYQYPEHEKKKN